MLCKGFSPPCLPVCTCNSPNPANGPLARATYRIVLFGSPRVNCGDYVFWQCCDPKGTGGGGLAFARAWNHTCV